MTLGDRIKRWWNPAQWREDHPEYSAGEGFALSAENSRLDRVAKPRRFQGRSDSRAYGRYGRR